MKKIIIILSVLLSLTSLSAAAQSEKVDVIKHTQVKSDTTVYDSLKSNTVINKKVVKKSNTSNSGKLISVNNLEKGVKAKNEINATNFKSQFLSLDEKGLKNFESGKGNYSKKVTGSSIDQTLNSKKQVESKLNNAIDKGIEENLKETQVGKKVEGDRKNIESTIKEAQNLDTETIIEKTEVSKKVESNKKDIEGKIENVRNLNSEEVIGKSEMGKQVMNHKDSNLQSMMGASESTPFSENNLTEGLEKETGLNASQLQDFSKDDIEKKLPQLSADGVNRLMPAGVKQPYNKYYQKVKKHKLKELKNKDYKDILVKKKGALPIPDKTYFEGMFSFTEDLSAISLSPQFGYKIKKNFTGGVGLSFQYTTDKEKDVKAVMGAKLFSKYELKNKPVYFKMETVSLIPGVSYLNVKEGDYDFENTMLIGAGYKLKLSEEMNFNIAFLYNVNSDIPSPTLSSPFLTRLGITLR